MSGKVREVKPVVGQAKRKVGMAGMVAKTHATRNKAVYIAGGGTAAALLAAYNAYKAKKGLAMQ